MKPVTLSQRAYRRIREKLSSGELLAGMPLPENQLSKELGMSRTPIREAFRQMEMEGLIDYEPRFGAVVRLPDLRELKEIYTVREALESYAAAAAADSIGPRDLERLGQLWERMQEIARQFAQGKDKLLDGDLLRSFLAVDLEFHQVIVDAAGNRTMTKIIDDTRLLIRVFTATFWRYDRRKLAQANGFHKRLYSALRRRDPEAARTVTVEAIRVARENALEAWATSQEPAA